MNQLLLNYIFNFINFKQDVFLQLPLLAYLSLSSHFSECSL